MKTKLSSFSLIELLITLAMILILAGLLLPVLQRTRSKAMDLSCQNMEKQIALAASQYILDNDDWILPAQDVESTDGSHSWFTLLAGNRTMQEVYTPPYGIRYSKMARNRNLAVSRRYSDLSGGNSRIGMERTVRRNSLWNCTDCRQSGSSGFRKRFSNAIP